MNFTAYLRQKKYSARTISGYAAYMEKFVQWLQREGIAEEQFTYTELLGFMRASQDEGITKRTVQNILGMIRHYCNYLITEGKRNDNPAAGVFIKGLVKKLPTNLLSREELEELYKQYQLQINVDPEKKILLGLLIYQGITVDEIIRLEHTHVKLKEGKVFIKGTKQTGERLLNLHAGQMIILQQYLTANKFKEGSLLKLEKKTAYSKRNISNQVKHMFTQLKKLNPKLLNALQIRSSVITHWLRQNNLRQVQYMAGHKYVSSTERYQTTHLDDLQNELQQHHPMNVSKTY